MSARLSALGGIVAGPSAHAAAAPISGVTRATPVTTPAVPSISRDPHLKPASMETLLRIARRFPVFPCDDQKKPRTQHGFKDATQEEEKIRQWWSMWPNALVGVPTGTVSGVVVLDVDPENLSERSKEWLSENTNHFIGTRINHTLHGGCHYFFTVPPGTRTRTCAAVVVKGERLDGIDTRGDGGYVILWSAHGLPAVGTAQMLPAELLPLFDTTIYYGTSKSNGNGGIIQEGGRNDYLSREAYRFRRSGASVEQIERILSAMNQECCVPPLEAAEVRQIAQGKSHVEPDPPANDRGPGRRAADGREPRGQAPAAPAPDERWPEPLPEAAYQGLIGKIARAIEPQTESDPAAVLLQVIVAFGALVGRGPHVRVEGDEHHVNLFALIVGDTSKSRKGTSWGRVRQIFASVIGGLTPPADWPAVVHGLSSGEGLKYAVRDERREIQTDKKTGDTDEVLVDPGVTDKRLLVVEPEFSQVLRQGARAGNTLSATIRAAWDTGDLMTLTKNDPVKATGAHVSIIGHITIDELRAELTATESANGFANRFLPMCVKRSKVLPFGGEPLAQVGRNDLVSRIRKAADHARELKSVEMTASARTVWERVYPTLSEGYSGLLGAVTARAEAQCLRLALAYALADGAREIDSPHLLAALAVWDRCAESARYIFGSALGDGVADEILRALRAAGAQGLTRTEISGLFRRHETAERIGAALQLLHRKGLASCRLHAASGRPAEIWYSAGCEKSELSEIRG